MTLRRFRTAWNSLWIFLMRERLGYRRKAPSIDPVLTPRDLQLRHDAEIKLRQAHAMNVYLEARKDVYWAGREHHP